MLVVKKTVVMMILRSCECVRSVSDRQTSHVSRSFVALEVESRSSDPSSMHEPTTNTYTTNNNQPPTTNNNLSICIYTFLHSAHLFSACVTDAPTQSRWLKLCHQNTVPLQAFVHVWEGGGGWRCALV